MPIKIILNIIVLFLTVVFYPNSNAEQNTPALNNDSRCHLNEAKKIISDALPGENTRAEKLLIHCIRVNPKNLEAILTLAQLTEKLVVSGEKSLFEIRKSLALLSQALALEPNNPKVRYAMAHLFATIGQFDESQNLYEKTMQEFPNSKETLIEKAKLIVEKDPDEALRLITDSIKMGTNVEEVINIILSSVHYKSNLNSYSKSLAIVSEQFQNRWLYYKLGMVYIEEKQYEAAAKAFNKAIQLGDTIEAKLQLAILQYKHLRDYKNSILNFEAIRKELEQRPAVSSLSHALVYSHYSLALYASNKKDEAAQAAKQVIMKSFGNRDFVKSLVYEYKERHALSLLQPALELVTLTDPSFDLAYAFLGEIYKENSDYNKSLDALDKAIALNKNNDVFYAIKGTVYYKLADYQNALKNFDQALQLCGKICLTAIVLFSLFDKESIE